jgi:hypothetical protein
VIGIIARLLYVGGHFHIEKNKQMFYTETIDSIGLGSKGFGWRKSA